MLYWSRAGGVHTFRAMTTLTTTTKPTSDEWSALAEEIATELADDAARSDSTGQISPQVFDVIRERGLLAALIPTEHGGGGAAHSDMGSILRILGRGDPAVAVTLSMHAHLVATQVWRHNHGQDAGGLFRRVAEERSFLISTGASDWVGSTGSARRIDGGYVVSARKSPASGCEIGQVLVTSIRWEEPPEGPQVIHCSIPMSADGVSIEQTWDTLGLRSTGSHTVVLDEVLVPDSAVALVRSASAWHPIWNAVLGSAMPLIMAAYLGVADVAVDLATAAVKGRSDPTVHQLMGEMLNAHTSAIDSVDAMFRHSDNLHFANTDAYAAATLSRKTTAGQAMIDTVRLAMEVTGGRAYLRTSPIERLYRDVLANQFHPLPRARQTQFTGRVALGLAPVA